MGCVMFPTQRVDVLMNGVMIFNSDGPPRKKKVELK